jgi:hypothetical protein
MASVARESALSFALEIVLTRWRLNVIKELIMIRCSVSNVEMDSVIRVSGLRRALKTVMKHHLDLHPILMLRSLDMLTTLINVMVSG